jgi:hypothetical protein
VQLQVGSDHLDFVRIRNLLAELVDIVTEAVQNDVYKKSTDHCLTARQAMERFTLPAPLLAKVFAIPSPIPLVEPVTKATLLIKAILLCIKDLWMEDATTGQIRVTVSKRAGAVKTKKVKASEVGNNG